VTDADRTPRTEEAAWLDEFARPARTAGHVEGGPRLSSASSSERGDPTPGDPGPVSWMETTWRDLSPAHRAATGAFERPDGHRERWAGVDEPARRTTPARDAGRVRTLRRAAGAALAAAQREHAPRIRDTLDMVVGTSSACHETRFARLLPPGPAAARTALLLHLGYENPRTWDGRLRHFWTHDPDALGAQLNEVARGAPLTIAAAEAAATRVGIPPLVPWWDLLSTRASPLVAHQNGWHRRT